MADAPESLCEARDALAERFGPVSGESSVYEFAFTRYYEAEMGPGLIKQLFRFAGLADPAMLAAAKEQALAIEARMARPAGEQRRRRANLDPGVVTADSLVLATTKFAGHRVCIAPGLYAEVTLRYECGQYAPLPWTYPDYRSDLVQRFLAELRGELLDARPES